jgi:hypothetical protein
MTCQNNTMKRTLVSLHIAMQLALILAASSNPIHNTVHALFHQPPGSKIHLDFAAFADAKKHRRPFLQDTFNTTNTTTFTANDSSKTFQVVPGHVISENTFWAHNIQGETIHLVRVTSQNDPDLPPVVVGSIVSTLDNVVYDIFADHQGHSQLRVRNASHFRPETNDNDNANQSDPDTRSNRTLLQSHPEYLRRGYHSAQVHPVHRHLQIDTPILDVMVVWTLNAECENAGLPLDCVPTSSTTLSIQAKIALAISETNQAYSNSGIRAHVRLVHSYRLDGYMESDSVTMLSHLYEPADGVIDEVHIVRAQVDADMVSLWTADSAMCGRSKYAYPTPTADRMMSVVAWDCATGYYTFGHELAHSMGCHHDRGGADMCTSTHTNFGYRSTTSRVRDIMALECKQGQCDNNPFTSCTRVAVYSNPTVSQWGVLGDAHNNCAAQINANAALVSSFYPLNVVVATNPTPPPTSKPIALPIPAVCGDGMCSAGESCLTCPSDCLSGTVTVAQCGNGVCEAGNDETYVSCPADCRGNPNAKNAYSCGMNGVCDVKWCNSGSYTCTTMPQGTVAYCCGDTVCSRGESHLTCPLDCP